MNVHDAAVEMFGGFNLDHCLRWLRKLPDEGIKESGFKLTRPLSFTTRLGSALRARGWPSSALQRCYAKAPADELRAVAFTNFRC